MRASRLKLPRDIARFILQSKMSARDLEELKIDPEAVQKIIGSVASPSPTVKGLRVDIQGPLRPDDLLARDLLMMARDDEKMCRGRFGPTDHMEFIAPEHTWTIKTKDGNLVGFAKLSEKQFVNARSGWELHLICSFRGAGMKLFKKMLTHYQKDANFLTLQPFDDATRKMYIEAATELGIGWTESGPDGLRIMTQFGRQVTVGNNESLTFWLRETPWALRMIQNRGLVWD